VDGIPEGLAFSHDVASLAQMTTLNLVTRFGDLDVAFEPAGITDYSQWQTDATLVTVLGVPDQLGRQRLALEYLAAVPLDVLGGWDKGAGTRPQRETVQVVHSAPRAGPGAERGRHLHLKLQIESQDAQVEELVVQRAESQAVAEIIRPAEGEPPHVRRVDPRGRPGQLPVLPAERALPIPCLQHREAPSWVTPAKHSGNLIR
jgi:hypothetical protein